MSWMPLEWFLSYSSMSSFTMHSLWVVLWTRHTYMHGWKANSPLPTFGPPVWHCWIHPGRWGNPASPSDTSQSDRRPRQPPVARDPCLARISGEVTRTGRKQPSRQWGTIQYTGRVCWGYLSMIFDTHELSQPIYYCTGKIKTSIQSTSTGIYLSHKG